MNHSVEGSCGKLFEEGITNKKGVKSNGKNYEFETELQIKVNLVFEVCKSCIQCCFIIRQNCISCELCLTRRQ